jgi:Phosphotransferase enzyme family
MADAERKFAGSEALSAIAAAAFGAADRIVSADRLPNGSKKGVYRLTLESGTSAICYVWSDSEDYWHGVLPEAAEDWANPFGHASGLDLFEAAERRLAAVGVRTPRLLLADRSKELYPSDFAVVEDITGGTLESLLDQDAAAAGPVLARLAESLEAMQGCQAAGFGKVALIDGGGASTAATCEQTVLDRALAEVVAIAAGTPGAAAGQAELDNKLRALAARVEPRTQYKLIHGELGPDHVLVDKHGAPVLIDVEGLLYFDIEWEHVFLRMRFGEHYQHLRRTDLDEHRMRFYQLAMHVSLVAGPLRIAATDHPERDWFLEIADYHLQRALEYDL